MERAVDYAGALDKVYQQESRKLSVANASLAAALAQLTENDHSLVEAALIQIASAAAGATEGLSSARVRPGTYSVGVHTLVPGDWPDETLRAAATRRSTIGAQIPAEGMEVRISSEYSEPQSWMSRKSTVLFYHGNAEDAARRLAQALSSVAGEEFEVARGAGRGVPPENIEWTLIAHYIPSAGVMDGGRQLVPLDEDIRRRIQGIILVFETGDPEPPYSLTIALKGDSGDMNYGITRAGLASGNLYRLIAAYRKETQPKHAAAFEPYLLRLENRDHKLAQDADFIALLGLAGTDPVMHEVQNAAWDSHYTWPVLEAAAALGIETPLGIAVITDSVVHGGWTYRRNDAVKKYGIPFGTNDGAAEKTWIEGKGGLLARTVSRMEAFEKLIADDNWGLELPFAVNGVDIP